MLEQIKLALRLHTDAFNDELDMYIGAVKSALLRVGVKEEKIVDDDKVIQTISIAYCKYMMDFQGQGERWHNIYDNLLRSIALDTRFK